MSEQFEQGRGVNGSFLPVYDRTDIINEICERLEQGEPLAQICREAHMPDYSAVYQWKDRDPEAARQIAEARSAGEQAIAARLRRVANGDAGYSSGDVQRDKLIIDTDFKLLAKWNPRQWGDNVQLRHADAQGEKLDTSTLVNELLSIMPGGAPLPDARPLIESKAQVRNVTPAAKTVYRPRRYDVDDLV